jgi:hypothetical protein
MVRVVLGRRHICELIIPAKYPQNEGDCGDFLSLRKVQPTLRKPCRPALVKFEHWFYNDNRWEWLSPPRIAGACRSPGPPLITAGVILEQVSVGPRWFPGCTRKEKDLPVLFSTPHSFLFEFEKGDFYSSRVSLRFGKRFFPFVLPRLICSSFVPQEQIPPAYAANLVQTSYAHEYLLLIPVHQSRIPIHDYPLTENHPMPSEPQVIYSMVRVGGLVFLTG